MNSLFTVLILLCCVSSSVALFSSFGGGKSVKSLKSELRTLSKVVNRGLTETPEQREQILSIFEQLEKKNPTKASHPRQREQIKVSFFLQQLHANSTQILYKYLKC
jgi:hypothetical protein